MRGSHSQDPWGVVCHEVTAHTVEFLGRREGNGAPVLAENARPPPGTAGKDAESLLPLSAECRGRQANV